MKLLSSTNREQTVPPVRPSAAETAWLRTQLEGLIDAMHESTVYWIKAAWRKAELPQDSVMASDKSPAAILTEAMKKLGQQWIHAFDNGSKTIAQGFADKTLRHHDLAFSSALRNSGFSVKFQTTQAIRDALDAQMMDNINLIKSIPHKYLNDVHGRVARSIVSGRDMKQLTKDLQEVYDLTHSRAALIARDQNNKATAIITKTRQKEVGISKARWVHTAASMHPREEHERWGEEGAVYYIDEGMWSDEDQDFVWPGTPINCGCTCMSIVPGMEEEE